MPPKIPREPFFESLAPIGGADDGLDAVFGIHAVCGAVRSNPVAPLRGLLGATTPGHWTGAPVNFGATALAAYTERMHALIESHREQLLSLARRRGVTSVRVFGSMVRGGAREDSDVDLLVTLAPGTSALALGGLLLDAQELLGRRVDVVTEASLHPALRDRVLADAVPL
jgi:predicted nucleotidyltransferase